MIGEILHGIFEWIIGLLRDTTWGLVEAFLANQMLRFPDWLTGQAWIINNRMTTLAIASYVVMVCIGGFLIMSNESLQATYSTREIVPRLITGFALAALSWTVISNLQTINNAVVEAMVLGDNDEEAPPLIFFDSFQLGVDVGSMIFIELIVAILHLVAMIMLFFTMLTRNVVWFLVASFAPVALACHALPFTEAAAFLWWRLIFACMASSIGQAALIWCWQTLFEGISASQVIESYTYKPFFVLALCWAIWKIHKAAFIWARGTPLRIPGGRLLKGIVKTAIIGAILRSNPLGLAVGAAAKRIPFLKGMASKLNPVKPKPRRRGAGTGPGRAEMPPVRRNAKPGPGKRPKDSSHRPKNRDDKKPGNGRQRPGNGAPSRSDRSGAPSKSARAQNRNGNAQKNRQRTGDKGGGNSGRPPANRQRAGNSTPSRSNPKRSPKPGWTPAGGEAPPQNSSRTPRRGHHSETPPTSSSPSQRRGPKPKWRPADLPESRTPPPDAGKRKWKPHPPPNGGKKWRKS